jgi:hypothetical protein
LYSVSQVLYSQPSKDTIEFVRVLYDLYSEIHVFEHVNLLYHIGRDDIILHEQGDSSYILNKYYLSGELLPDTV